MAGSALVAEPQRWLSHVVVTQQRSASQHVAVAVVIACDLALVLLVRVSRVACSPCGAASRATAAACCVLRAACCVLRRQAVLDLVFQLLYASTYTCTYMCTRPTYHWYYMCTYTCMPYCNMAYQMVKAMELEYPILSVSQLNIVLQ